MDNITLYNILVGSVRKSLNKAKVTGKLNLYDLHLLSLFGKLLNDFNTELTLKESNLLLNAIRTLQNKNSYICNYKDTATLANSNIINTKPSISNKTVSKSEITNFFTFSDFTSNFTDVNGDLPNKIKIKSLPTKGTLTYNGSNVSINDEFTSTTITSLLYTWTNYEVNTDTINFQVSDNNINNPLFSDMATMTLNITASVNLPPSQVGVISLNIDSADIHTFTVANFTTETTPVYLDPEGDAAKNVKITSLPTVGLLKYLNVNVTVNEVIPITGIANGDLTFVADANTATTYNDVFTFSISDEGSNTFTSGGQVTMIVAAYVNQAPTVGDVSITVDEGDVFVFTKNNFLIDADPDYSDLEGDLAVSVRFPTLPATGLIKLNNVNVTTNQEIPLTSVDSGLLTYTQAVNAGGTMPTFTFNIKDSNNNWSN